MSTSSSGPPFSPPSTSLLNDPAQAMSWSGSIPSELHLSPYDVADLSPPAPVHIMLPRVGYLHPCAEEAVEEFRKYSLQTSSPSVWFSGPSRSPLRFDLPVGVLFDLSCICRGCTRASSTPSQLPLKLHVHFSSYPEGLAAYAGGEAPKRMYCHQLKQGLFLEHGNARVGMRITRPMTDGLWSAAVKGDFETYKAVNDGIVADVEVGTVVKEEDGRTEEQKRVDVVREGILREKWEREKGEEEDDEKGRKKRDIVNVPVRVIDAGSEDQRVIQLPVKGSEGWTLGNVIEAFLGVPDASQVCRVVNGLYSVPDEASIAELWRACQSADHWLYVVTLNKEETER